jgi:hypothetical protein
MGAEERNEKKEKDLERMTVKELRAVAAESADLVGVHAMKKRSPKKRLKRPLSLPKRLRQRL